MVLSASSIPDKWDNSAQIASLQPFQVPPLIPDFDTTLYSPRFEEHG
jgi:hypothetical protein